MLLWSVAHCIQSLVTQEVIAIVFVLLPCEKAAVAEVAAEEKKKGEKDKQKVLLQLYLHTRGLGWSKLRVYNALSMIVSITSK